jgi:hypothetical protein
MGAEFRRTMVPQRQLKKQSMNSKSGVTIEPEVSGKRWQNVNLSQTLIPKPPLSKKVPFLAISGSLQEISGLKVLAKNKDPGNSENLI